jgi:DNA-binding IclR family transcriptional regulator
MDSIEDKLIESKSGVASGVGVLDRAVSILSLLAADGPVSAGAVIEETGLSRPTAYRLLSALEMHHLVTRREGRYSLGVRLLGWAAAAGTGLVERARPVLERLRDATGESTQLYVREGEHRVCVASVERATGLRDSVPVGAVMPLSRGSAGKVLLAWGEGEGSSYGIDAEKLEAVRSQGWAESVAEREAGVASVSVPVFGADGSLRAAVSASGPVSRLGERPGEQLAEEVVAAAREIETALDS